MPQTHLACAGLRREMFGMPCRANADVASKGFFLEETAPFALNVVGIVCQDGERQANRIRSAA